MINLANTESFHAEHTTKTILGFDHPNYIALRLAIEVLNAKDGYLWVCLLFRDGVETDLVKQCIRGLGLAYFVQLRLDIEAGHLSFHVYRVCASHHISSALASDTAFVARAQIISRPLYKREMLSGD